MRNLSEDVRDLAAHINENGKRLLHLDEYCRVQSERANAWHGKTETAIHAINDSVVAHESDAKKRHKSTESSLHQIGHDITGHHHDWENEVKKEEKGMKS